MVLIGVDEVCTTRAHYVILGEMTFRLGLLHLDWTCY